jgi:hypothetical protein
MELAPRVTTYAAAGSPDFVQSFARALPLARRAAFGALQTPAFDGPADPRSRVIVL